MRPADTPIHIYSLKRTGRESAAKEITRERERGNEDVLVREGKIPGSPAAPFMRRCYCDACLVRSIETWSLKPQSYEKAKFWLIS
jgi:hypothetical protein